MGFDEGSIVLNSPNDTYYAGQTIRGKLQFELQKKKSLRGIYIDIEGRAKTHWTKTKSVRVDGKTKHITIPCNGDESYFNSRQYFVGGNSGELELKPGSYCYDFEFHLEPTLPSSFSGTYGSIKYTMKVTVDRPWKFDQEKSRYFTVIAPMDLNLDPKYKAPIYIHLEDTYCCCWCKSGPVTAEVKVPMSGFVAEQVVPVEVYCQNLSNIEVLKIKLILFRKTSFYVTSPNNDSKEHDEDVLVVKKGPIPVGTTRSWTIDYVIPQSTHNVDRCSLIDIQHFFKVEVCVPAFHMNSDVSREVFLGTVALRNETFNQAVTKTDIPNNEIMYPYPAPRPIQTMPTALPNVTQQTFPGNNAGVVMPLPYPVYPTPTSYISGPPDAVPAGATPAGFGWRTGTQYTALTDTDNDTSYAYNPDVVPPEKQ